MLKKQIFINSIDAVKKLNQEATKLNCDVDIVSGRYVINAKSIMGLFSIDLSKPVEIVVHDNLESENFFSKVKEMIR